LAGLDLLAHRKRELEDGNSFKPPPHKVTVAADSVDEGEKPGSMENDATSLSGGSRGNSSRRYRGSGSSDDKTSLRGGLFLPLDRIPCLIGQETLWFYPLN
jgi:pre-mRNA-splicing factor ATP-dependent RNA helicase DHX38/PRP16